jgi:hypothetical protein
MRRDDTDLVEVYMTLEDELKIFDDDADCDNFLERLRIILKETATPCYGWALIPNHFICCCEPAKHPFPPSCAGY